MTHPMIYRVDILETPILQNWLYRAQFQWLPTKYIDITHKIYILVQRKISANIPFCTVSEQQFVVIPLPLYIFTHLYFNIFNKLSHHELWKGPLYSQRGVI